jgi:hypothetical protein
MSDKVLPLLFVNLGGEMLYVLDQRLNAQKIQNDKGRKIMSDIIVNMFNDKFLDEIFRPQELCSKKALKTIFERLAHTSIMRLNETSMDKLFDLMIMAVKYQICLCTKPREILLITLNHYDTIRSYARDSNNCLILLEQCYKRLAKIYLSMNEGEFQLIRQTLLGFFQDLRIKVSVFLREKSQNWNGYFIYPNGGPLPSGTSLPGTISYYDDGKSTVTRTTKFNPGVIYRPAEREGSYDINGDRCTKLGLNVYNSSKSTTLEATSIQANSSQVSNINSNNFQSDYESNIPDPKAKAQLDLLCKLIGSNTSSKQQNDFKLSLFNDDEEEL